MAEFGVDRVVNTSKLTAILTDIAETAEFEAENAKRRGEKQGNYKTIAKFARQALGLLQVKEPAE